MWPTCIARGVSPAAWRGATTWRRWPRACRRIWRNYWRAELEKIMRSAIAILSLFFVATVASGQDATPRIVALGDSITRGVRPGVKAEETFVRLLQNALATDNIKA